MRRALVCLDELASLPQAALHAGTSLVRQSYSPGAGNISGKL
jgi:hypothetical protein